MRLCMLFGAFLLIGSALITDALGIGTFAISIVVQKMLAKKRAAVATA